MASGSVVRCIGIGSASGLYSFADCCCLDRWCERGELDILRRPEKSSGSASARDTTTFGGAWCFLGEEFVGGEWGTVAEGGGTLAGGREVEEEGGGGRSTRSRAREALVDMRVSVSESIQERVYIRCISSLESEDSLSDIRWLSRISPPW